MRTPVVALLMLIVFQCFGQKKLTTIELTANIVYATIDRPGDIYLVTSDGQIQKFDKDGKLIIVYKHKNPTLFDPRDGAKLFAYYRSEQQYDFLSPSFEPVESYRIDSAFAIEPWLIAPSGQHKLWILDAADHSLKRVNIQQGTVEIEVVIDSKIVEDATLFTYLREYQGFVFMLNPKKGIFVFNSMGKFVRMIPTSGVSTFNFIGEELYVLQPGYLEFVDLFTTERREVNIDARPDLVLLSDERMFFVRDKAVDILEFKP